MNQALVRKKLAAAGAEYQAVRTSLESARVQLRPIVEEAIRAGLKQAEIVRLSGWTREYVRRLEKDLNKPAS